jgi:lysophospholipase L1-like esterase
MARVRAHDRLQQVAGTIAKLLFAVAVFGTTVGAYFFATNTARMHSPLPDHKESGGSCIVWLVGSSSIHRWKTAVTDLDGWQVHNRGIEGARLPELKQRLDLTRTGGTPSAIIFYAGENDLADAVGVPEVLDHLEQVATALVRHKPKAKVFLVSMKPSPARWNDRPAQLAVNEGLKQFARSQPNIYLVEAGDLLLTEGKPGNFFNSDGIHLSPQGYARWGGEIERQLNTRLDNRSGKCAAT